VLDLAKFAFDLLSAGVGIEKLQWRFVAKSPTWPLEPFRSLSAIAEYLDGEIIDSVDASKAI